jgi:hypothetical protein
VEERSRPLIDRSKKRLQLSERQVEWPDCIHRDRRSRQ